jgi:hypothetical protein
MTTNTDITTLSELTNIAGSEVLAVFDGSTARKLVLNTLMNLLKAYTDNATANAAASLVASAPATLNTLKELADALGDDPSFANTVTNLISQKLDAGAALQTAGPLAFSGTLGASPLLTLLVASATEASTALDNTKVLTPASLSAIVAALTAVSNLAGTLNTSKADKSVAISTVGPLTWSGTLGTSPTLTLNVASTTDVAVATDTTKIVTPASLSLLQAYQVSTAGDVSTLKLNATRVLYTVITASTYSPVIADAGKVIRCKNTTGTTITIPDHTFGFPIGTTIGISVAAGAGPVTVVGANSNVVINVAPGYTATSSGQNTVLQLVQDDVVDSWTLLGAVKVAS